LLVIPAKAGFSTAELVIQLSPHAEVELDPGFRRDDERKKPR
jgi:hypothetical protein